MIKEMRIIMFAAICLLPMLVINSMEPFYLKLALALLYEMILMWLFDFSSKWDKD